MQNESTQPSWHSVRSWRSPLIYIAIAGMIAGFAVERYFAHRREARFADSVASSSLASTPSDLEAVGPDERVLLTDLSNHTHDPELASAITEALRVDLEQSRRLQVLLVRPLHDTLRVAKHGVHAAISDSLARAAAIRDGAKALVGGDVDEFGAEYTIAVHLIDVQSGEIVDTVRVLRVSKMLESHVDEAERDPIRRRCESAIAALETAFARASSGRPACCLVTSPVKPTM